MRFKTFLKTQNSSELFESTFEKYYSRGYFGSIDKNEIKEQQRDWFDKFNFILEEGDLGMVISSLQSRDNICRDWFSNIYKVDVSNLGKKELLEQVKITMGLQ